MRVTVHPSIVHETKLPELHPGELMFVDISSKRIRELKFLPNGRVMIGDSNDILTDEAKENIFSDTDLRRKSRFIPIDEIADVVEPSDDEETDEVELDAEEDNDAPNAEPDEYERMALEHGGCDWDNEDNHVPYDTNNYPNSGYWTPRFLDLSDCNDDYGYESPVGDAYDDQESDLSDDEIDDVLEVADDETDEYPEDFSAYDFDPFEAEFQLMDHLEDAAEGFRPKIRDVVHENPANVTSRLYRRSERSVGRHKPKKAWRVICLVANMQSRRTFRNASYEASKEVAKHRAGYAHVGWKFATKRSRQYWRE